MASSFALNAGRNPCAGRRKAVWQNACRAGSVLRCCRNAAQNRPRWIDPAFTERKAGRPFGAKPEKKMRRHSSDPHFDVFRNRCGPCRPLHRIGDQVAEVLPSAPQHGARRRQRAFCSSFRKVGLAIRVRALGRQLFPSRWSAGMRQRAHDRNGNGRQNPSWLNSRMSPTNGAGTWTPQAQVLGLIRSLQAEPAWA